MSFILKVRPVRYVSRNLVRCINENIVYAAESYKTCLMNNIIECTYDRIKQFFKDVAPGKKSYSTLTYLFYRGRTEIPDLQLLQHLRNELQIENVTNYFADICSKWWKYIPASIMATNSSIPLQQMEYRFRFTWNGAKKQSRQMKNFWMELQSISKNKK